MMGAVLSHSQAAPALLPRASTSQRGLSRQQGRRGRPGQGRTCGGSRQRRQRAPLPVSPVGRRPAWPRKTTCSRCGGHHQMPSQACAQLAKPARNQDRQERACDGDCSSGQTPLCIRIYMTSAEKDASPLAPRDRVRGSHAGAAPGTCPRICPLRAAAWTHMRRRRPESPRRCRLRPR